MVDLNFDSKYTNSILKNTILFTSNFIEIFTGKKIENLKYLKYFATETFHYPELHEKSISFIILNRKIQYMMSFIGFEDFSINDYIMPDLSKNKKILLSLNSFRMYRINQIITLNKTGFNLQKINFECYLILNKIIINKYKIKYIKNKINKNSIQLKNIKKKLLNNNYFVKVLKYQNFFFEINYFFYNKNVSITKINIESKQNIQKRITWNINKYHYFILNYIKKKKKTFIVIIDLYIYNIKRLNLLLSFFINILNIFVIIDNIFTASIKFYYNNSQIKTKSILYIIVFLKIIKQKHEILNFFQFNKTIHFSLINILKTNEMSKLNNVITTIHNKKKYTFIFFSILKKNLKNKLKKISKFYQKKFFF